MIYCFGVDVGGTTVKMGLFQTDGKLLEKWEIVTRTEHDGAAILPDIASVILEKMKAHDLQPDQVLGIGIGIPAPVTEEGVVMNTVNLGWGYKEVRRELEALTGLRVATGNDASVAALGEMWMGGGRGCKDMILVTLGTGVGGGIIVDGKCIVGAHGAGGEIGHLRVNYEETELCGCGHRGCLEQYASATGIARLARRRLAEDEMPSLLRGRENLSAKDVFDAVKEGDQLAVQIAEQFGRYLGYGLANLAVVSDPAVIVIGGGVSKAGPVLLNYIIGPYREQAFFSNRDARFELAQLGNDAGIYGAVKLLM